MLTEQELSQVKSRAVKRIGKTLDNFNNLTLDERIFAYPSILMYNLFVADVFSHEALIKTCVSKTRELIGQIDRIKGIGQGNLLLGEHLKEAIKLEQIITQRKKRPNDSDNQPHQYNSSKRQRTSTSYNLREL